MTRRARLLGFLASVFLTGSLFAPLSAAESKGPTPFQLKAAQFMLKCGKCHTIGRGDRVGPDLRGVTAKRDRDWLIGFIQKPSAYLDSDPEAKKLLKKYNDIPMEDLGLSRAEVEGMLEYIEAASAGPVGPPEPEPLEEEDPYDKLKMPDEGMSFSLAGIVLLSLLLAAAGVLWQFELRRSAVLILIFAAAVAYWSLGGRRYHRLLGNQQGYKPVQPIEFSHKKHAGDMRIACLYCHHGAEKSDVAGVASVDTCMNCHAAVRKIKGNEDESREIAKLIAAWESRKTGFPEPIAWVRVHNLPDYVHFSHRNHVRNEIRCQECHGPVQKMERMRQASSLSMGWCVNCHRQGAGKAPSHWKRSVGPLDCTTCHW